MPTLHPAALGASTLALALLVGCGGREADGLDRARKAVATRSPEVALIEVKNFLQKHPKSTEGRFLLAQQLLANDEAVAAVAEYQRALEGGHPAHLVLPPMARALLRSGQAARVVSQFRDEQLTPAEAMADLSASVATAMALGGDAAGAQALIDRTLKDVPGSMPARLAKARLDVAAGRSAEGIQRLDDLLAEHPGHAEAWTTKGDLMLGAPGGLQAAAQAYEKALALRPGDVHTLDMMVSTQLALRDTEAAERAVQKLREVAPNRFETGRSEAALAYTKGDHARARELFQVLLKAVPTNVQLLLLAGENEMRLGANSQAEAMFAKASALAPGHAGARLLLAKAQLKLGQPPKALVTLAPLVDAPDAGAEVLAVAAEARLMNGETKAASALHARLAALKPTDARLRTIVASAALGRGDDTAALNALREIAAADKGSSADLALIAAHMQRGQTDAALAALAALDQKAPAEPRRHVLRGQVLASKQDWTGARQAFEAALAMDRGFLPAHAALAALDARQGKPDVAIQRVQALLKSQPTNAQAMLLLADLHERGGSTGKGDAEVLKLRDAAVKAAPASLDARLALINHHLARRDHETALTAAQAAVASFPDNLQLLAQLARCQMQVGQPSQALASFGKISTLQPKLPDGHLGAAAVYLADGQLDQAQRSIDRALEVAPGSTEARAQAIVLALRRNQHAKALAIAREVQAQQPAQATGQLLEADVLVHQQKFAQAASVLRAALDKPSAEKVPVALYRTLHRAGQAADAEAFASQWLASRPQALELMFAQGEHAQQRGDAATAQRLYARLLELQPQHASALNNQAMLLITQRKPGALPLARQATAQRPFDAALLDTLALALAAEGQVDEAIETQTRALAIAGDAPDLRLGLARLLIQAGKRPQAKAELQKLQTLGPAFGQQAEVGQLLQSLGPVLPGR